MLRCRLYIGMASNEACPRFWRGAIKDRKNRTISTVAEKLRLRGIGEARRLWRLSLDLAGRRMPDFRRVFGDRAVTRELAGGGHIDDCLAGPGLGVLVQLSDTLLCLGIGGQVRQVHEG